MPFTVHRPGGTKDSEFEAYARLLLQQGKDLGKLPRVPEPGTQNRWLYVWPTEQQATDFANQLRRSTRDDAWQVVQVDAPPSEGPLGPILIQLSRRSDGLVLALHPVSRAMLRSAYPDAPAQAGTVSITAHNWYQMMRLNMELRDVVLQSAPALTGLPEAELCNLGFAVIDDESRATLVHQRPADVHGAGAAAAAAPALG